MLKSNSKKYGYVVDSMSFNPSATLYLSTEHAAYRNDEEGIFGFNIPNSMYVDKAVKIVPMSVTVPNIFPNVNKYKNTWTLVGTGELSIPVKQYSASTLVAALSATSNLVFWNVSPDGYFQIAGVNQTLTSPTIDFFAMLGFASQVTYSNGVYSLSWTNTLTASDLPNLGGEKIIFIHIDKMGGGNMVNGEDGTLHDLVAHVSLHDVDFGMEGHWRSNDILIDDIEYRHYNKLDSLVVDIRDSRNRRLKLPANYHLRMMFKIFHRDSAWPKMPRGGQA